MTLDPTNLAVHPSESTDLVWVGVRADPEAVCGPPQDWYCLALDSWWLRGAQPMIWPGVDLPVGDAEVTILSDGPVEVALTLKGIKPQHVNTQEAFGAIAQIPGSAIGGGRVAFGGESGSVSRGLVAVAVFGDSGLQPASPDETNATTLAPCIYPHPYLAPDASPAPSDHPYGCDLNPLGATSDFQFQVERTLTTGGGVVLYDIEAQGDRYLGFRAASLSPNRPAPRAVGIWLEASPPA